MARRGDQRTRMDGEYQDRRDTERTRRHRRVEAADEPVEVMGEAINVEDYQQDYQEPRRRPQQRPERDGRSQRGDTGAAAARSDGERRPRRRTREEAPGDTAAQRPPRRRAKPQADSDLMNYFGETADFEVVEEERAPKRRRSGLASLFGAGTAARGDQRQDTPQGGRQRKARPRPQEADRVGERGNAQGAPSQEPSMAPEIPEAERVARQRKRPRAQEGERTVRRERTSGARRPEAAEEATPRRRRRVPQEAPAQDVTEIDGELLTFTPIQEETPGTPEATGSLGRPAKTRRRRPAVEQMDAQGQERKADRVTRTAPAEDADATRRRRRPRPETQETDAPEGTRRRRPQRAEADDVTDERARRGRRTRRPDEGSVAVAEGGRVAGSRTKTDVAAGEEGAKPTSRRRRPRHEAATQTPSGARQAPASEEAKAAAPATARRRKKRDVTERTVSTAESAATTAREARASGEGRREAAAPASAGRRPEGSSHEGAALQGRRPTGSEPLAAPMGGYDDFGGYDYGYDAGPFDQFGDAYAGYGNYDYGYGYGYDDGGSEWGGGRSGRSTPDRRGGSRPASLDWQRGLGHEGMTFEEDRRAEEAARAHRDARQRGVLGDLEQDLAERQDWLPDFGDDYDSFAPLYGDGRHDYMAGAYGLDDGLDGAILADVPKVAPKGSAPDADAAPIAQRPLWTPAPDVARYASPASRPWDSKGTGGEAEEGEDSWREFAELIARDAFVAPTSAGDRASEERKVGLAGVSGSSAEGMGAAAHTTASGVTSSTTAASMWRSAGQQDELDAGRASAKAAAPAAGDAFAYDPLEDEDLVEADEFDNYDDFNPFDPGVLEDDLPEGAGDGLVVDERETGTAADAVEESPDGDGAGEAAADAEGDRDATGATDETDSAYAAYVAYAERREESWVDVGYMPFVDDAPESLDGAGDAFAADDEDGTAIWADAIIDDVHEAVEPRDDTMGQYVQEARGEAETEPVAEPVPEDTGARSRVPNFIFGAQVSDPEIFEVDQSQDDEKAEERYEEWVDEVEEVEETAGVGQADEGGYGHDVYEDALIEEDVVLEDPVVEDAVLEDADDRASTYTVEDVEAEEVPTEHVEVHLDQSGPDETGSGGTFATKRRVPWRSKWKARHIVDDRAPRGPRKRRPVFLICYILLVVGLVAVGFVAYQYTYDSIVRYERSRSSTFMDNLIDDLQAGGEAAARRKDQIISSLELGAHDSRDLLSARLDRGVGRPGYRLEQQGKSIDATDPVYILYVDESPYLMVELHAVNSYVRFGILAITDWEIADAYVFEAGAKVESVQPLGEGQSMEVSVPDGAIAYVNGTALTGEDLSDPANILAGFVYASRFVDVPEAITYRVNGLHTAPEVWATDAAGNPVELSHSGGIYRATSLMVPNTTPDELPVDVLTLTETWSRFLTGDLGGADVNYGLGQVTSFLVPGSDLYERAVAYARGSEISFVMKHSLDSFSDESVNNCVRYNEDLFSCDAHFKKNMTLNATNTLRSDVFDNSLIFAYVDELGTVSQPGWYLVDMQPTGEVA